jgi:hypothetical protein
MDFRTEYDEVKKWLKSLERELIMIYTTFLSYNDDAATLTNHWITFFFIKKKKIKG